MKPIHLIAIAIIAVGIGALTLAARDVATYATFSEAAKTGEKVKIAGQLAKDKPVIYDPTKDPNKVSFFLKDASGVETHVVLLKAKPQDFEKSEQVVCTGEMQNGTFVASDVLLKCPSKYKDEEIYMKKNQ